ncbi:DUF6544 family protein [Nostoc sp.]|uniref:DUF6544 family protein n=1 Tax=Nostoc sp. TaxID=1180 RepID=UPI002FF5B067
MTNLVKTEFAIAGLIFITLLIFWFLWLMEERQLRRIGQSLAAQSSQEIFSEAMIADLPIPAQRYLRHAIQVGTPLASSLSLKFTGNTQFGAKSKLWPLKGTEILITPQRGFLWKETLQTGLLTQNGLLYYANGKGRVRWNFFELIPDPAKSGGGTNDAAKAMLGRFITKYIWTPFAFLPQQGAVWEAIDDEHAKVTVSVDGTPVTITLTIDAEGRLQESVSLRWGAKTEDGSFAYFPYGIKVEEEKTFDGYTIPSRLSAAWCYGDVDREPPLVFHYAIEKAHFS